jgi:hypothetical protein
MVLIVATQVLGEMNMSLIVPVWDRRCAYVPNNVESTCIKVKVALLSIKCRLPRYKLKIFIFLLIFTHRRKMLSARHHVCYWILSITAALVYQGLVTGLGFQENSFRIALIPLTGFAIYIIWNGPGHLSSEWHVHLQAAMACLMVCLGSVSGHLEMSDASAEQVKPIFHTFLAFSAISALESIRQNVSHPPILNKY